MWLYCPVHQKNDLHMIWQSEQSLWCMTYYVQFTHFWSLNKLFMVIGHQLSNNGIEVAIKGLIRAVSPSSQPGWSRCDVSSSIYLLTGYCLTSSPNKPSTGDWNLVRVMTVWLLKLTTVFMRLFYESEKLQVLTFTVITLCLFELKLILSPAWSD